MIAVGIREESRLVLAGSSAQIYSNDDSPPPGIPSGNGGVVAPDTSLDPGSSPPARRGGGGLRALNRRTQKKGCAWEGGAAGDRETVRSKRTHRGNSMAPIRGVTEWVESSDPVAAALGGRGARYPGVWGGIFPSARATARGTEYKLKR